MNDKELRERMAEWLAMRFVYGRDDAFNPLNYSGLSQNEREDVNRDANRLLSLIKENYVRLSDDQILPHRESFAAQMAQSELYGLGWRKVEVDNASE